MADPGTRRTPARRADTPSWMSVPGRSGRARARICCARSRPPGRLLRAPGLAHQPVVGERVARLERRVDRVARVRERVVVDHVADHRAVPLDRRRIEHLLERRRVPRTDRRVLARAARHVEQHDRQRPRLGLIPPSRATRVQREPSATSANARRALIVPPPRRAQLPHRSGRLLLDARPAAQHLRHLDRRQLAQRVRHLRVAARTEVRRAVGGHQPAVVGDHLLGRGAHRLQRLLGRARRLETAAAPARGRAASRP